MLRQEHTATARELHHALRRFSNLDGLGSGDDLASVVRYSPATHRAVWRLLVQLDRQGAIGGDDDELDASHMRRASRAVRSARAEAAHNLTNERE
jgi:hypothetical protein